MDQDQLTRLIEEAETIRGTLAVLAVIYAAGGLGVLIGLVFT